MKLMGGPRAGIDIVVPDGVTTIELAEDESGAYHKTRPTDSDWRNHVERDWFIRGLPEPVIPEKVFEWHERGWLSPEVRMIRQALE